jgi:adenylate kinase family enzyme
MKAEEAERRRLVFPILLIGPIGAGKTTLGRRLAERLSVPQVSSDKHCWRYYEELGFSALPAEARRGSDGMLASRFNVHAVERLMEEYGSRECVIDLGAGHSVYRDAPSLERVRKALAPAPHVILLLPASDQDESWAVLQERNTENDWLNGFREAHGYDPNEHFLRHPSNFSLATSVVYTAGRSPEETCDDLLGQIRASAP